MDDGAGEKEQVGFMLGCTLLELVQCSLNLFHVSYDGHFLT